MPVQVRAWDSRFFGYPVASAELGPAVPALAAVVDILQEARQAGIRLLYLSLPPLGNDLRRAVERAGARFVGRRREYAMAAHMPPPAAVQPDLVTCREHRAPLEALALASGEQSRFRLDPGFQNREFERLYAEWLAVALRGEGGKCAFVAGSRDAPRGLITVEPGPAARIGLLAVAADQRGRGLGRRLVAEAERFCVERGIGELRVATQAANPAACRLYEACGFQPIADTDWFHAWSPISAPTRRP